MTVAVASTASFVVPAGYAVESLGDGVYRLGATSDGRLVSSAPDAFPMDTLRPGPDRKLKTKAEVLPFAYSGDLWAGTNATAASTLSYSGPAGFADTAVVLLSVVAVRRRESSSVRSGVDCGFFRAQRFVDQVLLFRWSSMQEAYIATSYIPTWYDIFREDWTIC